MKNFIPLSRAEMKNVTGGKVAGGDCAAGQSLYTCTSVGSCATVTGYGCGSSPGSANDNQIKTWKTEQVWGNCYTQVSCSAVG